LDHALLRPWKDLTQRRLRRTGNLSGGVPLVTAPAGGASGASSSGFSAGSGGSRVPIGRYDGGGDFSSALY
jgi:hypothetical protein